MIKSTILSTALLAGMVACRPIATMPLEKVQLIPVTAEAVQQIVHEPGAKAVLVNVWASWCGPCREEFPDLVKLAHDYRSRGVRFVLISVDLKKDTEKAKQFLAEQGADFPVYISVSKDEELMAGLNPQWSGDIPSTMLFDGTGKVRDFWEGSETYTVFETKVQSIIGGKP